ncbi:MAG: nucleoside hydrolase [Clostridia bacterium]|nr:nucleoside hydrolase [Clostridia bacterium]
MSCPENIITVPNGVADIIVDTDAYCEVDDQFALAYLLRSPEKVNIVGIIAAPFYIPVPTGPVSSAEEGMEKSYDEIIEVLKAADREDLIPIVKKGCKGYLSDSISNCDNEGVRFIIEKSKQYTKENPLYIVGMGCPVNIISAMLIDPSITDRIVVTLLGGRKDTWGEFNFDQDPIATKLLYESDLKFVQTPAFGGVIDSFNISVNALKEKIEGKNKLCDFLYGRFYNIVINIKKGEMFWSRVLFDVIAAAWMLDKGGRFITTELTPKPHLADDKSYVTDATRPLMRKVTAIDHEAIFEDMFQKLING